MKKLTHDLKWSQNYAYVMGHRFKNPALAAVGIFVAAVIALYAVMLIFTSFKLRVATKKYAIAAFGIAMAQMFRIVNLGLGISGAAKGGLQVIPKVFSGIVVSVLCVSVWYFLYLWAGTYFIIFQDSKGGLKRVFKGVVVAIAVLFPAAAVTEGGLLFSFLFFLGISLIFSPSKRCSFITSTVQ
jgi:hypothetical protein